jgi:hypothetical protein
VNLSTTQNDLDTVTKQLKTTQYKLDDLERQSVFQPLSTEVKEKVIASIKEVRKKYRCDTPAIQIILNGNFMSNNVRSIINESIKIFLQSGLKVLPLAADSGYGFTGSGHILINHHKDRNDFVNDIIQSLSIFLGQRKDYQNEDLYTKEYISITISAEPLFMTDGSIRLK